MTRNTTSARATKAKAAQDQAADDATDAPDVQDTAPAPNDAPADAPAPLATPEEAPAPATEVHIVALTSNVAREYLEQVRDRAEAGGHTDAVEQATLQLAELDRLEAEARDRVAELGDAVPADARVIVQTAAAAAAALPAAAAFSPTAAEDTHHADWQTDAALEAVASFAANNPAGEAPATNPDQEV